MIRRFYNWTKNLTLTQQLVSIVLVSLLVFFVIATVYLDNYIDTYVRNQLFSMVKSNQNGIITESKLYSSYDFLAYNTDQSLGHAIYTPETDYFVYNNAFVEDSEVINDMKDKCRKQLEDSKNYVLDYGENEYLYTITKLNGDNYLVTCLSNAYRMNFKEAFVTTMTRTFVVCFGIFFLVLLSWVIHLIIALNQVKNYVNKAQKNEKVELKLDRKDEIGELATAVVDMNEELIRQQKQKEELIQNISHDLKTPIATIKSYAESIKDGIYPYDSLEKSVDVIIEHSERLEKKVQNLLLLNRMGYLEANEETGSCDLEKVVEMVLLSIKVIKPEIEIVKDTIPAQFYGDEEPWRVVIENLMDNALRYAKSKITIHLDENELYVENDGPFLSPDRIEKLFKPYEKGTGGKFGLGLSIVYRIVTTYNCEVYAYNSQNGVIFKVTKKYPKKKRKVQIQR